MAGSSGDILALPTAWRDKLRPASFGGARFHCESNSRESGRRIVEHQFPKKELPYAEDMGRSAREFSVRGYVIVFGSDSKTDPLKQRNYLVARDALMNRLETEGSSVLQLPTQPPQLVVCTRYRMAEEDRTGGFAMFDMTFQEYGLDPTNEAPVADTAKEVETTAKTVEDGVATSMSEPGSKTEVPVTAVPPP
jgi:prophage DNA circulation protein